MMKAGLFQRLFWRYLFALVMAVLILIGLTHWYQAQYFRGEKKGLHRRALEIAEGLNQDLSEETISNWKEAFPRIRMVVIDSGWRVLLDSDPEQDLIDLHLFRANKPMTQNFIAVTEIDSAHRLVVMQPMELRFPQTLQPRVPWLFHAPQWQLIAILTSMAVLISFLLYPLVRSLSKTFRQLSDLAGEVAGGHFGKELAVDRSDELGGLIRSFNHMSRKLAEAEHLNTRLIHDVSHELRSPLGRIRALADTIRYRPQDAAKCVDQMDQEVALLDRLVEDLATVARMESQPQTVILKPVSLQKWVQGMFERFQKKLRAEGIGWRLVCNGNDRTVAFDSQRLAQALGNLVENASVALGGKVGACLELVCHAEGDFWQLQLIDNGSGIPEEDLPFVFRRFYRVDKHRNREDGGTGLGLSIAKAIVEAHDGHIEIVSQVGVGTTVTMTIPASPQEN